MRRLCELLGEPQRSFRSLHVVGTNGKSSVTVICAALLRTAGLRTGACLSPHLRRWSERVRIDGAELSAAAFAAAVDRVAEAIPEVERGAGERVTQFEAAIAASFVALAGAEVDVAVIEAGLGGRLDATNVIPSEATALTSVALDHTQWLGESEEEIATEKLAVLREGTTLITGALGPAAGELARRTARERAAELVEAVPPAEEETPPGWPPYQRRNAGVALALARVIAPIQGGAQLRETLAAAGLPGRAELLGGDPPLLLDAAHNPEGAKALAEALPKLSGGRPVIGCVSVLADKDAAGIARALAPALALAICTEAGPGPAMGRPGATPVPARELAGLLAAAGCPAEVEVEPAAAVAAAERRAERIAGVALLTGSHYLLRHGWTGRPAQSSSR
jgi:dihydrofolate synthase / folylpolyglutamate synthase